MERCLYCYKPLTGGEKHLHAKCSRKFFGTSAVPTLDYTLNQLDELAGKIIESQTSLTGVQPKLSLHLNEHKGSQRLTIVGLWGTFICKPQTALFPMMPEVEDLTMHLAEISRIHIVPHTLFPMADGSLCYLTKRIDRLGDGGKLAMEDMCQITERMTEHKYLSSYEKIGKAIRLHSSMPKMDVADFFEVLLFSWITGNNDMHLKNFSLYSPDDNAIRLSPAYDLLNAVIINLKDDEELALTLNGRKKRIKKSDFVRAADSMGIDSGTVEKFVRKYFSLQPSFMSMIDGSFLSEELKQSYKMLIKERLSRLEIRT